MYVFIQSYTLPKVEIENLQNEGRTYEITEIILENGAEGNLVSGWSKRLLTSLEMNNFKEISDATQLSELILLFMICYIQKNY